MKIGVSARIAAAKTRLLDLHQRSSSGHLGGDFSCIDAMMVLHHEVMAPADAFVLSKGHSAGALYVTLWSLGRLTDCDLDSYLSEGTKLPAHPSATALPDVSFSSGSLGHGPSLASGLALAARDQKSARRVFCLCSDGEWQEGSCWEALTFAVHHKLANLTLLIDQNGLQGFGRTCDIASPVDLGFRIAAFGAAVVTVDGHDAGALASALRQTEEDRPVVIILHTVKGRGLPFADQMESHYLPLNAEQYERCRATFLMEIGR